MIGEIYLFLRLQFIQFESGFFISQSKYVKGMLKKFGFDDCKLVKTPLTIGYKLRNDDESPKVDKNNYKLMIHGLLYLTTSRIDTMQAMCLVARFQVNLKVTYQQAMKRIFRYLKGIMDFGLWYKKDGDWVGSVDEWKSTSGGAFFLGDRLVSQFSKKQDLISLSTTEAEYIATTSCYTQVICMRLTPKDIKVTYDE